MISCPRCSRANPPQASFCFHDGHLLGALRPDVARGRFGAPFVFPSGRTAWTFDELLLACLDEWPAAVELLRTGAIAAFLRGVGRADLSEHARQASLFPDADWALAELLERLPTRQMPDPQLSVGETTLDLGKVRPGQELSRPLRLGNDARGFLRGTITSDAPWLTVSPARFGCLDEIRVQVQTRGKNLRAAAAPLVGKLCIESTGGNAVVTVRVEVPTTSFAAGVLSGARTPRQLVEKAKANPGEAARLFESGAVARWYESNGWIYPVPAGATGRSAIEHFFVALGLPAPRIEAAAPPAAAAASPQPWYSNKPSPPPPPPPVPASDWKPITRATRPSKKVPALPIVLTPVRSRSRLWVLLMLPVALLTASTLAGVGVALSLPWKPAKEARVEGPPKKETPPPQPEVKPAPPIEKPPDRPIIAPPVRLDEPRPGATPIAPRSQPPTFVVPEFVSREVEVVFCLDTTGSMGGLLRGAQQKIWSICQQIAGGKPTPSLKVGLVAYRDKLDEYVTKVVDLSRDLDAVHQELMALSAGGGGDTPEHVNQALDEAITKVKWSEDKRTLKIVFLVGDAPAHMDYTDDVKYTDTCKKASGKGIFINTIQCGVDAQCATHWKDIAERAGGEYVRIAQAGGVHVVASPFDAKLEKLLAELMDTALNYGQAANRQAGDRMVQVAKTLRGPPAADRAAFAAKSKKLGPYDLLDALATKRVKLESVKVEELPEVLRKMKTPEERKTHIEATEKKRAALQTEILDLEKKRAEHIKTAMARGGGKDGFDQQVLTMLRKQAKKYEIDY